MTFHDIQTELARKIDERVLTLFGHALDEAKMQIPPRIEMGDLASAVAMELARPLKMSPREISKKLVDGFPLPASVESVTVEGAGYINFRIDRRTFLRNAVGDPAPHPGPATERILVEHTNINPNKAAHIGHLRNAVLGDTLVRCLRWLGHDVEIQNYIDDTGVQVADVVVGFQQLTGEGIDEVRKRIASTTPRFDYYCWDLYARVGAFYEESEDNKKLRAETLHEIESQQGETAELAALVSDAIVRHHIETMWRLGIRYDALTEESDIIKLRFWHAAFEHLKETGAVVYEEEGKHAGCWVMRLSDSPEFEGLEEPDKILVRSNGTVTYVGKDIAYQLWKFGLLPRGFEYKRFHRYPDGHTVWQSASSDGESGAPQFGDADRVYNVIDNRQAYLQKIVREGLRLMGHEKEADNSIHFSYEMVALSPATAADLGLTLSEDDQEKRTVEMSGRKGVGVKADDLLDALERKALEEVRSRADEGAGSDQDGDLARLIAIAALRYFMLKYGTNRVIAFDFAEALSFEGDSGPYLQYSTVRASNIFRKMAERGVATGLDTAQELDFLTVGDPINDEAWEIVRLASMTGEIVRRAVETLELSTITHHALELCQKFNTFYQKYSILNEPDPRERRRRAAVVEVFRKGMTTILELLGIPVPARM
ncbi:MAG: arginine--tRNA ligase [Acidobacteria bacterium]|nr:arginine--tRNA ligase [Acidobacteriota bacterium]